MLIMEQSEKVESSKDATRKAFDKKVKAVKGDSDTAPETYLSIMDDENENLFEMDLIFVRQKGVNEKFLEITFSEIEEVNGQKIKVSRVKEVRSKEEFDKIKEYFKNLSWG